jgi:hypothetical protein
VNRCAAGSKVWLNRFPGVRSPTPALIPPPARRNPVRSGKTVVKPVSMAAENARSGPRANVSDTGSKREEVFVSGTLMDSEVLPPISQRAPVGEAHRDVVLPGHRRVGELPEAIPVTCCDGDGGLGSSPGGVHGQGEGPGGGEHRGVHRSAAHHRAEAVDLGTLTGEHRGQLGVASDEDGVVRGIEAGDRRTGGGRNARRSGSAAPGRPSARGEHGAALDGKKQQAGDDLATVHRLPR